MGATATRAPPRRESTEVAVFGAGPAGLASGACLRRAGIDFVIFEREDTVGSSWRRHYDRLHLHTLKRYSSLPFLSFPKDYPRYVPRALMVAYLESYAQNFDLAPRFNEAVQDIRRDGADWVVESGSTTVRAPFVVVASGYNAEPVIPPLKGLQKFKGSVSHSADYRNAAPFAGKSVLVIGMGKTGAEIALDLAEIHAQPTISLRVGVHIVPRELFGVPIQLVAMLATGSLPLKFNDVLFPPILDLALGNLAKFGIKRPALGILEQIRSSAKIPVIDVGTVDKIVQGAIKIVPGISEVVEDGACFEDGTRKRFDAIVLATGYRSSHASFLKAHDLEPTDEAARDSGLYFIGFRNRVSGLLNEISKEAMAAANDIAKRRMSAVR